MSRATAALALAVVVFAGCSSGGGSSERSVTTHATRATTTITPTSSAGCGKTVAPGVTEHTLTFGGVERKYQLTLPADYDGSKPLPVVLALHALTVSYQFVSSMTGFADMAPKYEFIGVAPSGRLDGATPYWNAAPVPDNDDVAFLGALLDTLETDLCVDPTRVFSVGMSNGAQMSSELACQMAGRVTAVAAIAGVEFYPSCHGRPVAVIAFHGTADPIVTYDGGGLNATKISETYYWKGPAPSGLPVHHGVDRAMHDWAAHNGCDPTPREEQVTPAVQKRTWQHCRAATALYVIDGAGHTWPGKPVPSFEAQFGPGTTDVDASSLLFDFFFSH